MDPPHWQKLWFYGNRKTLDIKYAYPGWDEYTTWNFRGKNVAHFADEETEAWRSGDIRGFAPGGLGAQPGCHLVPACLAPSVRCFPQGQMEEARAGPTDGDSHGLVLLQLGPERDRLCLRDGH